MAGGRRNRNGRNRTSSAATPSNTQQKPPAVPINESVIVPWLLRQVDGYAKHVLERMEQYASTERIIVQDVDGRTFIISAVGEEKLLRAADECLIDFFGCGFANDEKAAVTALFEQILIRKMKEKEYFFCAYCNMALYNYKQALVHFTHSDHRDTVQAVYDISANNYVREHGLRQGACDNTQERSLESVLVAAGGLHERLAEEDKRIEHGGHRWLGRVNRRQPHNLLPDEQFMKKLSLKYCAQLASLTGSSDAPPAPRVPRSRREAAPRAAAIDGNDDSSEELPPEDAPTADIVRHMQGDLGRNIMADLNEHLGEKKTWCAFCGLKTGDREGLYTHYTSHAHLKKLKEMGYDGRVPIRCEIQTAAVNVQRKDLIKS